MRLIDADKFEAFMYQNDNDDFDNGVQFVLEMIDKAPTVHINKWIPTKEKLPASNELVDDVDKYYLVQNAYDDMMVAHYDGKGWKQIYDDKYDEVVAWMELPKRYVND